MSAGGDVADRVARCALGYWARPGGHGHRARGRQTQCHHLSPPLPRRQQHWDRRANGTRHLHAQLRAQPQLPPRLLPTAVGEGASGVWLPLPGNGGHMARRSTEQRGGVTTQPGGRLRPCGGVDWAAWAGTAAQTWKPAAPACAMHGPASEVAWVHCGQGWGKATQRTHTYTQHRCKAQRRGHL